MARAHPVHALVPGWTNSSVGKLKIVVFACIDFPNPDKRDKPRLCGISALTKLFSAGKARRK
jgi:hypothetical protein